MQQFAYKFWPYKTCWTRLNLLRSFHKFKLTTFGASTLKGLCNLNSYLTAFHLFFTWSYVYSLKPLLCFEFVLKLQAQAKLKLFIFLEKKGVIVRMRVSGIAIMLSFWALPSLTKARECTKAIRGSNQGQIGDFERRNLWEGKDSVIRVHNLDFFALPADPL